MDTNELGTLGLITVTFAMPLLVLAVHDLRNRQPRRRPVPIRAQAPRRTRSQAHPIQHVQRP